ncbi:Stk1 family PASTA domain-containing Ser/Thr kinase [Gemella sp. GH3]|uniref:Stk1 family PASTA domain-containing Ser/Thr kinase n=1 Tax=unclassified Gemella TaxID=2624949 RepID=UPI0015D0152B|nr:MULTISPECIES: Stk1 family PASTA domain-containing Ser/Thr kinase [unclassified Gemella]MBF0714379.1 Stk1 family PASTA domain-containing Ser/Thr kinase [Gemella sp. GH3.1]NYS51331.1 Stk1 family PASTA domain-containing Ser/Thr kinase [Gemella sp. GH3]
MIGRIICDRYKIIDHLGTGGMATVWLAEDTILNRQVAIKTFKIDSYDEDAIKRFNREANAVTSLSHPNIVSIYGVENEDNFYYLILEYVEGMTLKEYMLQNKNIPLETVIHIMKQISEGLSHAHKNGIIHRDIKPQNILMTKDLNCKITDFGISRAYGDTTLTQTNQMLGTVYYLSPEQARGNIATAQSDIYSLGILMFELITGKIPFKGESAVAIALKHLQEELPDIENYRQEIPRSIKNIIKKATMKNPNERYVSANELREDLETSLDTSRLNETVYTGFSNINNNDLEQTRVQQIVSKPNQVEHIRENNISQNNIEQNDQTKINEKKSSTFGRILAIILLLIFITGTSIFAYNYFVGSNKVSVPDVKNLTVQEAKSALNKAELTVGEIIEVPSDSVSSNQVISSDPSAGKKVSKGSKVNLNVSSGKATIEVTNYIGMTENQAKNALEKVGFKNITFEKSDSDTYEAGKVMAQSIEAGKTVVPKETSITITISTGAKKITAPNLKGKTLTEAYKIADNLGINIKVEKYEYNSNFEENQIAEQRTEENSEIKKGDTISVVVSKGKEPLVKITMPNFVGGSLRSLQSWADTNNVNLSISYNSSSTKSVGTVLSQSIKSGESIVLDNTNLAVTVSGSAEENR